MQCVYVFDRIKTKSIKKKKLKKILQMKENTLWARVRVYLYMTKYLQNKYTVYLTS